MMSEVYKLQQECFSNQRDFPSSIKSRLLFEDPCLRLRGAFLNNKQPDFLLSAIQSLFVCASVDVKGKSGKLSLDVSGMTEAISAFPTVTTDK